MPIAKRAATLPVEALKQIMVGPVPRLEPGYLIARSCLHHEMVPPEMYRGEIEVEDGRPMRGQDHQYEIRRSYGQEHPELDDYDSVFLPYATEEISPKRSIDTHQLIKLGANKSLARLSRNLLLARRTMLFNEEAAVANLLFTAANWGSNTSTLAALPGGSAAKIGQAGAKEFDDLAIAADLASYTMDNHRPTDLVLGVEVLNALRGATQMREYIGDSGVRPTDDELVGYIRRVTGVSRVHIGRARVETERSGAASNRQNIWGDAAAFYWRDVDASMSTNGLSTFGGTAMGIVLDYPSGDGLVAGADGYFSKQNVLTDPPKISMIAGVERTQLFLNETDGSTGTQLDPRGYLVTDLV